MLILTYFFLIVVAIFLEVAACFFFCLTCFLWAVNFMLLRFLFIHWNQILWDYVFKEAYFHCPFLGHAGAEFDLYCLTLQSVVGVPSRVDVFLSFLFPMYFLSRASPKRSFNSCILLPYYWIKSIRYLLFS